MRLRLVRLIPGDPLDSPHFTARLIRWRAFLADRIHAFAPGETGAVLAAMLVGDRSRLSAGLNVSFRRSGLSHLLVVSGLHLVILSRMVWLFLAPFVRERRRAFFLIGFCWGFALLTGAGSSVVRAAVMLTLAQIGDLLGRRGDTLTSLSVAGVLMAVQNPGAILTASFQLSFGAVAGIALLSAPIERLLAGEAPGAVRSWLAANLSAGLAAQAGAAPALLATFGLFPLLGIAANLLVVGIIAPMMTLGLLSLFFSFAFPGLCAILLPACRGLALLLILTARFFSALPFAQMGISFRWQTAGAGRTAVPCGSAAGPPPGQGRFPGCAARMVCRFSHRSGPFSGPFPEPCRPSDHRKRRCLGFAGHTGGRSRHSRRHLGGRRPRRRAHASRGPANRRGAPVVESGRASPFPPARPLRREAAGRFLRFSGAAPLLQRSPAHSLWTSR